jgi:hypothetical protein
MADHGVLEKIMEDQQDQKPAWAIDQTKYVWITDNSLVCCGEPNAMVAQCKFCEDTIECQYHNDWDSPHCKGQIKLEASKFGQDIEAARNHWATIARENNWYVEPFYIQVWVDEYNIIQDSVSTRNLTQDVILKEATCVECEETYEDSRYMNNNVCSSCVQAELKEWSASTESAE